MENDSPPIHMKDQLQSRLRIVESKLDSLNEKPDWLKIVSTTWPIFTVLIAAIVYIVVGLANKASADTVSVQSREIGVLQTESKESTKKIDWLVDEFYKWRTNPVAPVSAKP